MTIFQLGYLLILIPCVSGIWTSLTWLWWFGFRLKPILGYYRATPKGTKNNRLDTLTKVLLKSLKHYVSRSVIPERCAESSIWYRLIGFFFFAISSGFLHQICSRFFLWQSRKASTIFFFFDLKFFYRPDGIRLRRVPLQARGKLDQRDSARC